MDPQEFIQIALDQISDEPMNRASDRVKEVLQLTGSFFDSHLHIFDRKCVPLPYFLIKGRRSNDMNNSPIPLIKKANTSLSDDEINQKLKKGAFKEIFLLDSQKDILSFLYQFLYEKNKTIITPLMMDLGKAWDKEATKTVFEQLSEVKDLISEYPILPFFAVDPRRAEDTSNNLYQNFLKAFSVNKSFFGVKVYPSAGYLPSDPALMPIYKICEQKNIPITTHCGSALIGSLHKPNNIEGLEIIKGEIVKYEPSVNFGYIKRAQFFNNPKLWEVVLRSYPKLKLNFGHFGGSKNWRNHINGKNAERIDIITNLMYKYKNVYADISIINDIKDFNKILNDDFYFNSDLLSRTLFGTDFHLSLASSNIKSSINRLYNSANWNQIAYENPYSFLIKKAI